VQIHRIAKDQSTTGGDRHTARQLQPSRREGDKILCDGQALLSQRLADFDRLLALASMPHLARGRVDDVAAVTEAAGIRRNYKSDSLIWQRVGRCGGWLILSKQRRRNEAKKQTKRD